MGTNNKHRTLCVKITQERYDALQAVAKSKNLCLSEVVRALLESSPFLEIDPVAEEQWVQLSYLLNHLRGIADGIQDDDNSLALAIESLHAIRSSLSGNGGNK